MLTAGVFLPLSNSNWIGGLNYYRNFLTAANRYSAGRFKFVVLTDHPKLLEDVSGEYGVVEDMPTLNWRRTKIAPYLGRLYLKSGRYDFVRLAQARIRRLDVLSHNAVGFQLSIPTLTWIPDFQHRALPELFTSADKKERDRAVVTANRLKHILLSSYSAQQDLLQYYPEFTADVHVLPFASMGNLPLESSSVSLGDLMRIYNIPDRFIYLPNQFWTHKNHEIVVKALALDGDDVTVVCTGSASDYRNASHFQRIQSLASQNELDKSFRILGLVPYNHVLALMRHSIAVLNPSRFEGWSTTVEEAKLLGKPLILSALPVHMEQASSSARYFDPDDYVSLRSCLDQIMLQHRTDSSMSQNELDAAAERRQRAFVDRYYGILEQMVS